MRMTILAAALAMLLAAGCGADPTGITAPPTQRPGSGSSGGTGVDPDATVNNTGGSGDTTLNLPGSGGPGSGVDETNGSIYTPQIETPEAESFVKHSASGEDDLVAWLKDCYETLPEDDGRAGVFQNESLRAFAAEIYEISNAVRIEHGLQPLRYEPNLELLAQAHARDMALRDYFAHDTPDGVLAFDRWRAVNSPFLLRAGENAAKGQKSAQMVVDRWLGSPGHRRMLLDPDVEWTGVGVYFDVTDRDMPLHVIAEYGKFREDPRTHSWYQRGEVWSR